MTTSLRADLVFDMDGRDAGAFIFIDGARHIDLVAVAGVGVGDHGNIHGPRDH